MHHIETVWYAALLTTGKELKAIVAHVMLISTEKNCFAMIAPEKKKNNSVDFELSFEYFISFLIFDIHKSIEHESISN